jgi:predicted N-acetyltransferase YhbS
MPDMLVNLLKVPPAEPLIHELAARGIVIRRAQPFEITPVLEFVEQEFSVAWADEISIGFSYKPVTVFVATANGNVIGFAAYECTRRGFFGPTGVADDVQKQGIGKALLVACLWGLRELGYVYGIIGRAGPVDYYRATVGATEIPDTDPGIYIDLLK